MCGICGAVDFGGAADAAALVHSMTPAMRHRGPDDGGFLIEGRVAIGMRRVSIIDLEGGINRSSMKTDRVARALEKQN
jgi:asparagine synthase (glutamine-hydrolysing)